MGPEREKSSIISLIHSLTDDESEALFFASLMDSTIRVKFFYFVDNKFVIGAHNNVRPIRFWDDLQGVF